MNRRKDDRRLNFRLAVIGAWPAAAAAAQFLSVAFDTSRLWPFNPIPV